MNWDKRTRRREGVGKTRKLYHRDGSQTISLVVDETHEGEKKSWLVLCKIKFTIQES
jgi:hypothetical protein